MSIRKTKVLTLVIILVMIFCTMIQGEAAASQRTVEGTVASMGITNNDSYFTENGKDTFIKDFLNKFQLEPSSTLKEFKERALSDNSTWNKMTLGSITVDEKGDVDIENYTEQCVNINKLANENNIVFILTKDDFYIVNANATDKPDTLYTSTVGKQNWHNLRTNFASIISDDAVCIYRPIPELKHLPLDILNKTSPSGFRTDPISGQTAFHSGVDYAMPTGSNIYAVMDGTVKEASKMRNGCIYVVLQHRDGYTTGYFHCSELNCKVGDVVQAGDVIAKVGSTGYSTGPHLHFEYRKDGQFLVPEDFIDSIPR